MKYSSLIVYRKFGELCRFRHRVNYFNMSHEEMCISNTFWGKHFQTTHVENNETYYLCRLFFEKCLYKQKGTVPTFMNLIFL